MKGGGAREGGREGGGGARECLEVGVRGVLVVQVREEAPLRTRVRARARVHKRVRVPSLERKPPAFIGTKTACLHWNGNRPPSLEWSARVREAGLAAVVGAEAQHPLTACLHCNGNRPPSLERSARARGAGLAAVVGAEAVVEGDDVVGAHRDPLACRHWMTRMG